MRSYSALIDRRARLEPTGEALVEDRPLGLRERLVGGVADEDVAELEDVAGRQLGTLGPDKLLAHKREHRRVRPPPVTPRSASSVTAACSNTRPTTLARSATSRSFGGQALEAGREQGTDRGRDPDLPTLVGGVPAAVRSLRQQAVVDEHPEQLLDEQRVALGGRADPGFDGGRESAATGQGRDQPAVASAPSGSSRRVVALTSLSPQPGRRPAAPDGPGRAGGSARPG